MTNAARLQDSLRELFRKVLATEAPPPEVDLIEAGLLDSLALVELLFEVEREFQIELRLDELDIENFRTLGRMCDLVARLIPTHSPGMERADADGPSVVRRAVSGGSTDD